MPNKFILIAIITVAFLVILNLQKTVNPIDQPKKVSQVDDTKPVTDEQIDDLSINLTTNTPEKSSELNKENTVDIEEATSETVVNQDYVYDPDPVVDAHLIMEKHRMCYLLIQQSSQDMDFKKRLNRRLKGPQREFFAKYESYCKNLGEKNPVFRFDDFSQLQSQKDNAKATSLWGQVISGEVDGDSLNPYEIRDLLKQNDPNILSDAPSYLRGYYQEVVHWDLEDVLQNRHYDYVSLIRNYAHQMHLCNLGVDCSANGIAMVRLCFADPMSCGLTFQQYHDQILTAGQQADVSMALSYLQGQYQ